jgi:hypothetical protein
MSAVMIGFVYELMEERDEDYIGAMFSSIFPYMP